MAPCVQRRKVWLTPSTRVPCSNAAKTRNPLKFAGVPKPANRSQPLVCRSSLYHEDMWGGIGVLQVFFRLSIHALAACKDTARQSCAMVPKWRFLRLILSASRVQHISDMLSAFALRPHHVWKYGIQSATAEIRRGKKEERTRRKTR